MVDKEDLFTIIKSWIETHSTLKAIPSEDNGPIEDKTFFTYRFDAFTQIGIEETSHPDEITELAMIKSDEDFTCEIQCFGPGAMDESRKLRDTLQLPAVQELFCNGSVSVWDWLPVQNITALDQSEFEERASFDIMMRLRNETKDVDLGVIKDVEGTGTLTKPDGTDQSVDFEVTTS